MDSQVLPAGATIQTEQLSNGQLVIVTLGRLALNIAYRIIYPLLPFLALRLDVSLQTISALVTIQVAASLVSPLGGILAARLGQRATMALSLVVFCVGTLLCAASGTFVAFLIGYGLIGMSVALYQPAAQAYLSARTHYSKRGWALGVLEISWAAAALVGIAPLMYLVEQTGDQRPVFLVLLALGIASFALVRLALPPTPRPLAGPGRIDWSALRRPRVLAVLAMFALVMFGIDQVFVVQGAWLEQSFGADESDLGLVFGMQGIAELLGSVGAALFVDRIGKKRAVMAGFGAMMLLLLLLPLGEGRWALFLPLFFLFDLAFEFGLVSAFPLASGVAPAVRGTVLALCIAANGIGRTVGSLTSEPLWRTFGIATNCFVAAIAAGLALALCGLCVHEAETSDAGGI